MAATLVLPPTDAGIATAAELLRQGAAVAFPTETVYGLGADATCPAAVAGVYAAKGRPAHNPLIVHLADVAAARRLAVFDAAAERLAAAFWPGPLTLVLPLAAGCGLAPAATAGLATVALRVPDHRVARALIAAAGRPLVAPSANASGRVSPTTAAHVLDGLGGRIAAVLDGGACAVGVESTIVGLGAGAARLLRPGGLPAEAIAAVLGRPLAPPPDTPGAAPTAPGQLASHYAPRAALRLGAAAARPGEVFVGFGAGPGEPALSLSPAGDPAEAARRLFDVLRRADAQAGPGGTIAVAPVPEAGLGAAVNDRLRRAAAPRPDDAGQTTRATT
jgi:L-threonylcarbamoyladenylate synthase